MTAAQVNSEAAAKTRSDQLYLDDLHVGQCFTSGAHRLDEAQIKAFAIQFDPQPFHTNEQAAERTFFQGLGGERLAHRRDHDASECREWSATHASHARGRNDGWSRSYGEGTARL